jgi:hypothetical protein
MKQLRLLLILSAVGLCTVRAQREREPEPIPDFSNLEDFVYEPKTTLTYGFRTLKGGKVTFNGRGTLSTLAIEQTGSATDRDIQRTYHDGDLSPDNRNLGFEQDADGNLILNEDGSARPIPIVPDGLTNRWQYYFGSQATDSPGYIAMHTYSAAITETRSRSKDLGRSQGMEVAVARDMGRLFGTRMSWTLSAGMTIDDIAASSSGNVRANITKMTDLYSLNGVAAPTAPYNSRNPPSSTTRPALDADGNPLFNEDGTPQTVPVQDDPILLGNAPVSRTFTTKTDETSVTTHARLKGAYYTFRAGPTLWVPISNRFRASLSFGATMIYAGATYSVTQVLDPETGADMIESATSDDTKVLAGYYADATLQFDVTARTGFYAGAVFQGTNGDYSQEINAANANYSSKLDFGHQQGFRAGMTIKF